MLDHLNQHILLVTFDHFLGKWRRQELLLLLGSGLHLYLDFSLPHVRLRRFLRADLHLEAALFEMQRRPLGSQEPWWLVVVSPQFTAAAVNVLDTDAHILAHEGVIEVRKHIMIVLTVLELGRHQGRTISLHAEGDLPLMVLLRRLQSTS